jgi:hypothetical protein
MRGLIGLVLVGSMGLAMHAQDAPAGDAPQGGQRQGRRGGMGMGQGNGGGVGGTVTAVSETSLSLKSEAGEAYTIDLTANTRLMKDRQPIKTTDIKVGDNLMAMGMQEPGKHEIHAAVVMVMTPEQAAQMRAREKEMRENLGKTIIAGRITKIDEAKITVMRPDNVEQIIVADENTSFRKGGGGRGMGGPMGMSGGGAASDTPPAGESITLADVKVGENITGRGALKGGVFVPTTLTIMEARRPRSDGAPAPPPPSAQQ